MQPTERDKVVHVFGVERLTGRPVALPVEALLNGIGNFRAHLYRAFHSGRTKETRRGSEAMPISRSTLAELSGVGASSQRAYEAQVDVEIQENFAVGERATKENYENRAWTQVQAVFELKDYRGQQGKKGQTHLAWQLPNSYIGAHAHRPKGRQKRINRELKDLVMKGMLGNVEETRETRAPEKGFARKLKKVFFPNGKLAAKACTAAVRTRNATGAGTEPGTAVSSCGNSWGMGGVEDASFCVCLRKKVAALLGI